MPVIEDKYSRWASVKPPSTLDSEKSSVACSTRLRRGIFVAEIVADDAGDGPIYHMIVQRVGSPEVLSLAQERSFRGALDQAHMSLERLVQQRRKRRQRAAIYKVGMLSKSG
jgi:hypothetical protein